MVNACLLLYIRLSFFKSLIFLCGMRLCLSSSVCIWNFKYVQRVYLWWHAIDQGPQLFDHSFYQFLFVSLILPELREDVVLLTDVFHSAPRERGKVNVTRCIYAICFLLMFYHINDNLTSCQQAGMLSGQSLENPIHQPDWELGLSRRCSQTFHSYLAAFTWAAQFSRLSLFQQSVMLLSFFSF